MSSGRSKEESNLRVVDDARSQETGAANPVSSSRGLPLQLTSFVGREREIAEVANLLGRTRLLTLTGPGGSGKTRLALRAAELAGGFEDGPLWVELASLSDPALVSRRVARALGVPDAPGRSPTEGLAEVFGPRDFLLVLDNCEHLIEASAELCDALLRLCPALRILATSREALSVTGEVVWTVPPLALPDPNRSPAFEEVERCEAVRLFVERAGASNAGFALTEENAPAVARLCARLDGMPLAIELAASRTRVLSPSMIFDRLDDRFTLLTGGGRTTVPRHRTLQATIEWSHGLLPEDEKALLRRLSVFADGFVLEAAEAVCAGGGIGEGEVLDLLSRLVDKSLAVVDARGGAEARYRLLETIRQYARERLREAGEESGVQRRHAGYYLAVARTAAPNLRGAAQSEWLTRLEAEHDNLRAALAFYGSAPADAETFLQLTAELWWFWWLRGHFAEGRVWLERALAAAGEAPSPARASALHGAGWFDRHQGEQDRAERLLGESLSLYRALGDEWGQSIVLHRLGAVARDLGDVPKASEWLGESLTLARRTGDELATGAALYWSGLLEWNRGDHARAEELLEEGLTLFRRSGDGWATNRALGFLGSVAAESPDYGRAQTLLENALATGREVGDRWGVACWLYNLGRLDLRRRDVPGAVSYLSESLALFRDIGDKQRVAECLATLGVAAQESGDPESAARLLGAATVVREAVGSSASRAELAERDLASAAARDALGRDRFSDAWGEGLSMTIDEAMVLIQVRASAAEAPAARGAAGLTGRELEVLRLVGKGMTDGEAAEELYLSPRTVGTHLRSVYRKLGVPSRAAAVRKGSELGLI